MIDDDALWACVSMIDVWWSCDPSLPPPLFFSEMLLLACSQLGQVLFTHKYWWRCCPVMVVTNVTDALRATLPCCRFFGVRLGGFSAVVSIKFILTLRFGYTITFFKHEIAQDYGLRQRLRSPLYPRISVMYYMEFLRTRLRYHLFRVLKGIPWIPPCWWIHTHTSQLDDETKGWTLRIPPCCWFFPTWRSYLPMKNKKPVHPKTTLHAGQSLADKQLTSDAGSKKMILPWTYDEFQDGRSSMILRMKIYTWILTDDTPTSFFRTLYRRDLTHNGRPIFFFF